MAGWGHDARLLLGSAKWVAQLGAFAAPALRTTGQAHLASFGFQRARILSCRASGHSIKPRSRRGLRCWRTALRIEGFDETAGTAHFLHLSNAWLHAPTSGPNADTHSHGARPRQLEAWFQRTSTRRPRIGPDMTLGTNVSHGERDTMPKVYRTWRTRIRPLRGRGDPLEGHDHRNAAGAPMPPESSAQIRPAIRTRQVLDPARRGRQAARITICTAR